MHVHLNMRTHTFAAHLHILTKYLRAWKSFHNKPECVQHGGSDIEEPVISRCRRCRFKRTPPFHSIHFSNLQMSQKVEEKNGAREEPVGGGNQKKTETKWTVICQLNSDTVLLLITCAADREDRRSSVASAI